jgi:hypothetical protein
LWITIFWGKQRRKIKMVWIPNKFKKHMKPKENPSLPLWIGSFILATLLTVAIILVFIDGTWLESALLPFTSDYYFWIVIGGGFVILAIGILVIQNVKSKGQLITSWIVIGIGSAPALIICYGVILFFAVAYKLWEFFHGGSSSSSSRSKDAKIYVLDGGSKIGYYYGDKNGSWTSIDSAVYDMSDEEVGKICYYGGEIVGTANNGHGCKSHSDTGKVLDNDYNEIVTVNTSAASAVAYVLIRKLV